MNIYDRPVDLRLTLTEFHTIVAALAYVNHPSFVKTRERVVDLGRQQGLEL